MIAAKEKTEDKLCKPVQKYIMAKQKEKKECIATLCAISILRSLAKNYTEAEQLGL